MTQKITMIVGEPCVGKSTVMKALLNQQGSVFSNSVKYIPLHILHEPRNVFVLGRYDESEHQYPGTDRMSMACQPHALHLIENNRGFNFLFEGDRLGNNSMIDSLLTRGDVDLAVVFITMPSIDLLERQKRERPNQNPKFWVSRKTKVNNVAKHVYDLRTGESQTWERLHVHSIPHVLPQDTQKIVDFLVKERM